MLFQEKIEKELRNIHNTTKLDYSDLMGWDYMWYGHSTCKNYLNIHVSSISLYLNSIGYYILSISYNYDGLGVSYYILVIKEGDEIKHSLIDSIGKFDIDTFNIPDNYDGFQDYLDYDGDDCYNGNDLEKEFLSLFSSTDYNSHEGLSLPNFHIS